MGYGFRQSVAPAAPCVDSCPRLSTQPCTDFNGMRVSSSLAIFSALRVSEVAVVRLPAHRKGGRDHLGELLLERLIENDEKLELPVGNARAIRLRGLSFPTRVGSPRKASALRNAIDVLLFGQRYSRHRCRC